MVLNAIAMKYVIQFRCFDFYMDEQYAPASPLVNVFFPVDAVVPGKKSAINSDVFIKSKPPPPQPSSPVKRQNKFIKGGPLYGYSFLSTSEWIPTPFVPEGTYRDMFNMTYADYKQQLMCKN
jgi:hypothetical protein